MMVGMILVTVGMDGKLVESICNPVMIKGYSHTHSLDEAASIYSQNQ